MRWSDERKDKRCVHKKEDFPLSQNGSVRGGTLPYPGKRDDISLREKEAQIKKDLNDGIDTVGGKMTVCQLYDKKNSQRKNIKRTTEKYSI